MKVTKNKRGSNNWGPAEIRELMSFIPEQSAQGVPWEERAHLWKARFGTTRSGASLRAQFTRIKNGWYPQNVMRLLSEGVTSDFIEITNPTENRRHSISFTPETASEAYQSVRKEKASVSSTPNSFEPSRAATPVCLSSPPSCQSTTPSCTNVPSSLVSQLLVSCLKFCIVIATATPKKPTTSLSHIRYKVQKTHRKVPPVDGNGRQ
ncbi:hypothetical protein KXV35_006780, partial [Aspergillus fumigatus]